VGAEPETTLAWAEFFWRVVKNVPEVAFAYLLLFEYAHRQWRGRKGARPKASPVFLELSPANCTSNASLVLTTGIDAGTQAVLNQMAELSPYEFPSN